MKKLIFLIIFLFSTVCHAKIDIVFAIDNNYPVYTMLVINSIMKNNVSKQDYTFWVFETGITDENKTKMTEYVKSVGQEIKFITIDPEYIKKWSKLYAAHITPIAMSRILIPELLPQDMEKVLYLDSDILVAEDLKNLYDEDLGDYFVAMAHDDVYSRVPKYMNAGVMLINLPKWRSTNLTKQMLDYLDAHEEEFSCNDAPFWIKSGCYMYKDQDLIHIFLKNLTKRLDGRWNNADIKNEKVTWETQRGIYHFVGGGARKPWLSRVTDPQKLYWKYWEEVPHIQVYFHENET